MDENIINKLWKKTISSESFKDLDPSVTYRGKTLSSNSETVSFSPCTTLFGETIKKALKSGTQEELAKAVEALQDGLSQLPETNDSLSPNEEACETQTNPLMFPDTSTAYDEKTDSFPHQNKENSLSSSNSLTEKSFSTAQKTNYQVEDKIAQGGMGIVFKGQQTSLQREIAIKMLLDQQKTETRNRFISESLITASLDHPNIVPIYELGENHDGNILLAMKLIRGTEWKNLLHPETPEDKKRALQYDLAGSLQILLNVCNAVAYAHSKGIVHNDLKPSNIMIGEFGEILVMDWGIAVDIKEPQQSKDVMHKSMVDSPMGTPHYMPSELAKGSGKDIGPWTDVYLLGGILYEILMGKPPHAGNLYSVLISAVKGTLPEFNDNVPMYLQNICHKALAGSQKERYQSVVEFREAIEKFLQHRESMLITDRAQQRLIDCQKMLGNYSESSGLSEEKRNLLYDNFAQTIAGFEQAILLWKENESALTGKVQARFSYAETALQCEDFGLANTQANLLIDDTPGKKELLQQIIQVQEIKETKAIGKNLSRICLFFSIISLFYLLGGTLDTSIHKRQIFQFESYQLYITGFFCCLSFAFYSCFHWGSFTRNTILNMALLFEGLGVCLITIVECPRIAVSLKLPDYYASCIWMIFFRLSIFLPFKKALIGGIISGTMPLIIILFVILNWNYPVPFNYLLWDIILFHFFVGVAIPMCVRWEEYKKQRRFLLLFLSVLILVGLFVFLLYGLQLNK